jgi:hypothetical protein
MSTPSANNYYYPVTAVDSENQSQALLTVANPHDSVRSHESKQSDRQAGRHGRSGRAVRAAQKHGVVLAPAWHPSCVAYLSAGAHAGREMTDDDLRMLARAAYTVLRELKPSSVIHTSINNKTLGLFYNSFPDPAYTRAQKYIDFVWRRNPAIWDSETRRDDEIKIGFRP